MTDRPDAEGFDAATAADPSTPLEVLARIAAERPDLRAQVAANPSAYPDLLSWLGGLGDPAVDAALATRSGGDTGDGSAADPAAPVPAAPAAPDPAAPAAAGGWSAAASGADAAAGADSTPGADPTGMDPGVGGTGAAPRRSRRGLRIGLALGGAAVLLGGGVAAYAMIFSKMGGSSSPDAAVTQLVNGVADFDGVAVFGSLSPAETGALRDLYETNRDSAVAQDVDYEAFLSEVTEAVELEVTDLELEVDEVQDGLARVTFTSGDVSLDADTAALRDTFVDFMAEASEQSGQELPPEMLEGLQDDAALDEIDAELPLSGTITDLVVPGADGDVEPFLMAVEEDGAWYVSPMMTVGEYVAEVNGFERSPMLTDEQAGGHDSPEAAMTGFFDGITAFSQSGDILDIARNLGLAERRLLSVYGPAWTSDLGDMTGSPTLEFPVAEFSPIEELDGRTRMRIDSLEIAVQGESETVRIDGLCAAVPGEEPMCLDEIPLAVELGVGDMGLMATEDSAGWHLGIGDTVIDTFGVLSENLIRLQEEGLLEDEEWLRENLGPLGEQLGDPADLLMGGPEGLDDFGGTDELGAPEDLGSPDDLPDPFADTETDFTALVQACEDGDMAGCDELYLTTPLGSDEEEIGSTCGGRVEEPVFGQCVAELGETVPEGAPTTTG